MRVNCEVEDRTADGTPAYGLRWWTEKGVDPEVRWIPSSMVHTARTAIAVIKEVTVEAREIAAWYEQNPKKLYLPPSFEHLRCEEFISLGEAEQLLGVAKAHSWGTPRGVRSFYCDRGRKLKFQDLECAILKDLPDSFPIVEQGTRLLASEALFLCQLNEFRTDCGTSQCMIEPVTQRQIRDALGARAE